MAGAVRLRDFAYTLALGVLASLVGTFGISFSGMKFPSEVLVLVGIVGLALSGALAMILVDLTVKRSRRWLWAMPVASFGFGVSWASLGMLLFDEAKLGELGPVFALFALLITGCAALVFGVSIGVFLSDFIFKDR